MDATDRSRQHRTLEEPRVSALLAQLRNEAWGRSQGLPSARLAAHHLIDRLLRRIPSAREEAERARDIYMCLGPDQGRLAYLLARTIEARRIVEFGTSFGVSTIYFAAAVRDNGGGVVIGSELEPSKAARARAHLKQAGLADLVEIREGDALETLADPGGTIDLLLLDGWKELYLPVLELLRPHLRRGSIVLADNIRLFRRALAPYLELVRDPGSGFASALVPAGLDAMEVSVRL